MGPIHWAPKHSLARRRRCAVNGPMTAVSEIRLPSVAATHRFGAKLAGLLHAGDVVLLQGDLGAGKTELARGVARGLTGPDTVVPSPTFTLVQTYETAALDLWHFDLYRLENPAEIWELGWEDALNDGASLVEWPQRLGPLTPADALLIELDIIPPGPERRARLTGAGLWSERVGRLTQDFAETA